MKKSVYLYALVLIILIGITSYVIWSNVQKQNSVKQIIVVNVFGLKGPTFIGMIKLFEENPILGGGVQTTYDTLPNPDLLKTKLLNKEADFATMPTNLAATIYNKGIDYRLAAVTSWGVLYLISTDNNVKDWNNLIGKSVNITDKGLTPDIIFRYLADKNGINPEKDVKLDYLLSQAPDLAAAMIAGRVKTGVLPEPFVTMVLQGNKNAKITLDLQNEWKKINGANIPFAQTCLVVKNDFAKTNPEIVAKFLNEYKKSIDWVNANAKTAGSLVEKHKIGITSSVAEISIPRCNLRFEDAQQSKEAVKSFLKVLFDFSPRDLGGKLPDENFYYKK